jgi:hypothetical protein
MTKLLFVFLQLSTENVDIHQGTAKRNVGTRAKCALTGQLELSASK